MHILLVLMWKHLTVRKRRYFSTAFEILSPCAIFLLIYYMRNEIMAVAAAQGKTARYRSMLHPATRNKDSMPLKQIDWAPLLVLYTPNSIVANALMSEAAPRLNLQRLKEMPDHDSVGYYGFSHAELNNISSFAENMHDSTAIVIFQDMEGSVWPFRLNYTIRMKLEYKVHIYHALKDNLWRQDNFGAMYEPFMQLQWAIDSAYLKLLTGSEVYKNVELKRFPLAETQTNPSVVAVTAAVTEACANGLLLPYIFFMIRLIEERSCGIQELVRMSGAHPNMILASHFVNMMPSGLMYMFSGILSLQLLKPHLIPQSNALLLMIALGLDYSAMLARGLALSFILKTSQHAVIFSMMSYFAFYMIYKQLNNLISEYNWEFGVPLRFSGLLPHVPVFWFWTEVGSIESYGDGLSFSNMFKSHPKGGPSAFFALTTLLAQILVFLFIAKVLSVVRPGKFGIKQPWYSVFELGKKKKQPRELLVLKDDDEEAPKRDPRFFENPPANAVVGIRVQEVTKIYGVNRVLNKISFDVYRGEITVLLGHNGAGKTTLMSIITGMISVTYGKVFVNGYDIVKDQQSLQRQIGFCTQDNIFFPDLTVAEHIRFFSMLRGKSRMESLENTQELLVQLNIQDKAKNKSATLSGGMKRRLQLAMALAGEANVLILDEPTSGLDVETRRELWDLMLLLRGARTVVLSTHFMEEADALGDRVVAIHSGTVRCHATPMALKKGVGTGYRLNLTTIGRPKEDLISPAIAKIIPDAFVKEKTYNSITYNLPASESEKFSKLFSMLEEKKDQLRIDTIGVGVSTLEEVFLKLCSDVSTSFGDDKMDEKEISKKDFKKVKGFTLYFRQFRVLFRRQVLFIRYNKINVLIMQILIPLLVIYFTAYVLLMTPEDSTSVNLPLTMDLDIHKDNHDRRVLYDFDPVLINPLQEAYNDVLFRRRGDIVLRRSSEKKESLKDSEYLFELDMNDTSATIYYKPTVHHAVPMAINMLSNVLASHYLGLRDGQSIVTINHPIEGVPLAKAGHKLYYGLSIVNGALFTTITTFVIQQSAYEGSALAIRERDAGTRHIHVMSGCPPLVLWATALVAQASFYCCFLVLPALPTVFFDTNNYTFTQASFVVTFGWLLMQGIFTFLPFCYVVGWFCSHTSASILIAIFCLLGFVGVHLNYLTDLLQMEIGAFRMIGSFLLYTFPPYTSMAGMYHATFVARNNAYCTLNKWMCPRIYKHANYRGFDPARCCAGKTDCNFCWTEIAPGSKMLILFFQFIFYSTITLAAQYGLLNTLVTRMKSYDPKPQRFYDRVVEDEKFYVSELIKKPNISEALLVDDLHKQYSRCLQCKRPFRAVSGVSWSVQKGECFGLLGVNGAGKSTTFKMISGEETPTRGKLYSSGHHLKYPRENYLKTLGYCPQFFGLDDFMTGKDNLELLLTLRGLDDADVISETKTWISVVGLEKYTNVKVHGYSGGCVRRLGTAAGLGSGAPLVLLDEPTSGVDVSARRRVWVAMRRGLKQQQGIVITSHSMDEMEALCDRIAIMSAGEIGALGSPAMLRAQHAAGHALVIKLKPDKYEDIEAAQVAVDELKEAVETQFDCTLKDEHMTMLHYHINSSMPYSELFAELESLKQRFPQLVEDYSVTETTLEEVFLSFAHAPEKSNQTKQTASSSNTSPSSATSPSTSGPSTSRSSPSRSTPS